MASRPGESPAVSLAFASGMNFPTREESAAEQGALEIKAAQIAAGLRPALTFLADEPLRQALRTSAYPHLGTHADAHDHLQLSRGG